MFTLTEAQDIAFIVVLFQGTGGLFVILGVLLVLFDFMGPTPSPWYSPDHNISLMSIVGGILLLLLAVPLASVFAWAYRVGGLVSAFLSQKFWVAIVQLTYGEAILIVAVIGLGYVYLSASKPTYRKTPERWW